MKRQQSAIEIDLRETVRSQGKAKSTADAYWFWLNRFLRFCKKEKLGRETKAERAVEQFLTMLTSRENVSDNTQNQAFSALCYYYRHCRKRPLEGVSALRAKRPDVEREVLSREELVALFENLSGVALLASRMMYASGFRIGEVISLRIKDLRFHAEQIVVRRGKGKKDRVVQFPASIHDAVRRQMESMAVLHKHDVADGLAGVSLPFAYGKKTPKARLDFAWWYLFAADHYSRCPTTGALLRHHRDPGNLARQIKQAVRSAGILRHVTAHCLRHSFATHSLDSGVPVHFVQQLLGHASLETTQIYTHASKASVTSSASPIDALQQVLRDPPTRSQQSTPVKLRIFAG